MERVHSAPTEQNMFVSTDISLERSNSTMSNWQSFDDQSNAYVYSDASSLARQQALQPIDEAMFSNDSNMVEYSPDDYVNNHLVDSSSHSPLSQPQPQHLSPLQLTNNQWMPSLDASTSPSTPSAAMTPVTLSSNSMSRQSSFNPPFGDGVVSMMRTDSSMYPLIPDDGTFSYSQLDVSHVPKNISAPADTLPFLSVSASSSSSSASGFTGQPSETLFLSPANVSTASLSDSSPCVSTPSVDALASRPDNDLEASCTPAEHTHMQRSTSTWSTASSSNASITSMSPPPHARHVRREREILAQAGACRIAPKTTSPPASSKAASSSSSSSSPTATMLRIQSSDGSSRQVGVISKAPYVRPSHPKILCPHCSERPEGFRGTHELDRHVARAHTAVRKGYMCVAPGFDKNFLSGCKHCRNKKVYGAYYNAAAHLRRAHFHPRKRGRKGKNDEKRGGIGGGDDPPMDYLKQHWIREVEVENVGKAAKRQGKSTAVEPESEGEGSAYEADGYPAEQQQQHQQQQMQQQPNLDAMGGLPQEPYVDFAAYAGMDMDMNMSTSAVYMYPSAPAPPPPPPPHHPSSDVSLHDFEFDVYRT